MAHIIITTTEEERDKVLNTLKGIVGETVSVTEIARRADMSPSRVRYSITDLEDAGKIRRIPTKAFNKYYVRYKYEVI